jgi:hypothetical protein
VVKDPNVELRSVSSFHAIHVSSAFEVILTQDDKEAVAVSAGEQEYVSHIQTKVENGVLRIWFDGKSKFFRNPKLKAYISAKNLEEIKASGASDIKIDGQFTFSDLRLELSGASDMNGTIAVKGAFKVDLSGASDLNISGSAEDINIDASGASDVKAFDFKVSTCKVDASGASDVHISVDKELSAKLSGASSLDYKGTPVIRDIITSGASNISHKS